MHERVAGPAHLKQCIEWNVRDDFKGRMYLMFGFLSEAKAVAERRKDKVLLKMIQKSR
jgi:hypothetical protein